MQRSTKIKHSRHRDFAYALAHRMICTKFSLTLLLSVVVAGCSVVPGTAHHQIQPLPPQAVEVSMRALALVGSEYRYGGKRIEDGFDCSGLVNYIYSQVTQQHYSYNADAWAKNSSAITKNNLREGDLVFFNTRNKPWSHVGVYIGEGQFVHAANEKSGIRIDFLTSPYYSKRFDGARRLIDE